MTVLTEGTHAAEFLLSELPGLMSRKQVVVNLGQNLAAGAVVARPLVAAAAAAVGVPTGDGAITIGAVGPDAVPGTYVLTLAAAAANAGTFNFNAPDGGLIRQITVGGGATASSHLTLTIADGAADFVVGDTFEIVVTEGDTTVLAPAGTDGTQIASGVLYAAVDATAADTEGTIVHRDAAVLASSLVWPAGITAGEKAAALAQLGGSNIITR